MVSARKNKGQVYINAISAEGSVFPFISVAEKTAAISTFDPEWNYQKILERVKATCFSPHRYDTPSYKLGPVKVAEHFQVKRCLYLI